jgi:PhzF family phenazine biosynthesis protein
MNIPIYQVDAFTSKIFSGNPAAVCILERWLDDDIMQAIAAENNLSETAFLVEDGDGFDLRWFTPVTEVALCGHATLASAFVLFVCRRWEAEVIRFQTRKSGQLTVTRRGDLFEMDFPVRPAQPRAMPKGLDRALGAACEQVYAAAEDVMVVMDSEKRVAELRPDVAALERIDCRGIIVTAQSERVPRERCDFVSRFFAPRVGVPEDPVTGSAHCVLIPYWADVLDQKALHAFQVSKRGGELFCRLAGDRVKIAGKAALYLEGVVTI